VSERSGRALADAQATGWDKPILFVHGDRDEFGSMGPLRELVNRIQQHNEAVSLHVIKDSGHFFEGHLDELKQTIADWMNGQIGTAGP
jgi:alpha/beta superfamily hydrolase